MKINILRYILALVPEVPRGRPPKVQRACGLIPSPARVIQPESPNPCVNLRRSKRKIVPPARYDPAIWDLS